ncbi:MAG: CHASE2 domain-containing protein, partial [Desulfobacterales bacterium]|nr:CHASE2 domain-containing protein [Desulfobacterales bacterium]
MKFFKKKPTRFVGLGITVIFLALGVVRLEFLDALDLKLYDGMMNLRGDPRVSSQIVLVDIDEGSLEKLGRWPWPRSILARCIDKVSKGDPRVIGLNLILSETEVNPGLKALGDLEERFLATIEDRSEEGGGAFLKALNDARTELDNDAKLMEALRASGRVVLPVFLEESVAPAKGEADEALVDQSVQNIRSNPDADFPRADKIIRPIPDFFKYAGAIGHINLAYEIDGKVRRERPLYEYNDVFIPSYALSLSALYLKTPKNKMRANLGSAVFLGDLEIPTTPSTEFLVGFKGMEGPFKSYSFFDVINDKIPPRVFKGKIVIISPSAPGIRNPLSTPSDPAMSVGEFTANIIWSILNKNTIQQPSWDYSAELLMIVALGLVIAFLLPGLRALFAGAAFVALFAVILGGAMGAFVSKGLWIRTAYPLTELVLGYIAVITLKYFVTETRKEKVEGESAKAKRELGLNWQSQGKLDMALETLRRIPMDDEMMDILYNLALDFERKRQFNKAADIYAKIEEHDAGYKDVSEKKKKLIRISETIVIGGGPPLAADLLEGDSEIRPTLNRYEIHKELGKGGFGVVYLGHDPRMNRTIAIKTYRFTDDFTPEEAEKIKVNFFREAESAGNLSHPNIVSIFDTGEDHDLAYIIMEYLKGVELTKYTKKSKLLPMRKIVGFMADVAEALGYAHERGIVHRDIKPANVMLLESG